MARGLKFASRACVFACNETAKGLRRLGSRRRRPEIVRRRPLKRELRSRERSEACTPSKSAASVAAPGRLRCQDSTPKVAGPRTLLASIAALEASEHMGWLLSKPATLGSAESRRKGRTASGDKSAANHAGGGRSKRSRDLESVLRPNSERPLLASSAGRARAQRRRSVPHSTSENQRLHGPIDWMT